MSSRGGNGGVMAGLLAAVVVVPFVGAAALLGPERAWGLAQAAVESTICDPFNEERPVHRLPVVRTTSTGDGSGRGIWADGTLTMPYIEEGHAIVLERATPVVPVRRVTLVHGVVAHQLHAHVVAQAAGRMGVLTTWGRPVWHITEGTSGHVVWLHEVPHADLLRDRGVGDAPVSIARIGADGWRTLVSAPGVSTAEPLLTLLSDSTRSLMDRRDAVESTVDVEAALRYLAAGDVLGTHVPPLWVWHPMRARWMPVLRASDGQGASEPVDPILRAMSDEPEWLMRRAELRTACREIVDRAGMLREFDRLWSDLRPSLVADRRRLGHVVENDTNLYPVPVSWVEAEVHRVRQQAMQSHEEERR